jgi:hypothetical protein
MWHHLSLHNYAHYWLFQVNFLSLTPGRLSLIFCPDRDREWEQSFGSKLHQTGGPCTLSILLGDIYIPEHPNPHPRSPIPWWQKISEIGILFLYLVYIYYDMIIDKHTDFMNLIFLQGGLSPVLHALSLVHFLIKYRWKKSSREASVRVLN